MVLSVVWLVAGLVILYFGAEALVDGASRIALSFGVSPMIVGLTVVAFATSAPEFVVSLLATLRGTPDLAVGNVVGSNIANIALIVGATAIILPIVVERSVLRRDYPFMIAATALAIVLGWVGGAYSQTDALIFLLLLFAFLGACLRVALKQNKVFRDTAAMRAVTEPEKPPSRLVPLVKCVIGLVGLVVGAQLMVLGAVDIAQTFGISELVIGVTILAFGTSLPELATSIVAAVRKQADISLGNIIGSNIFNVGFILGGVGILSPIRVSEQAARFDLPVMGLIALVLYPIARFSGRVGRLSGAFLLSLYIGYIVSTYLISMGTIDIGLSPS